MEKAFKTQWKAIDKTLAQDKIKDAEHFRLQSELAHEANGFFGNRQIRVVDNSLQAWVDNLDIF